MTRALDHLVIPTFDLAGLAKSFRRSGFQVGSRNRHPWGTENHVIQFDGNFIELIGLADGYEPVSDDDPAHPFTRFISSFLGREDGGVAMSVLESDGAVADAAAFQRAGIGRNRVLPFSRSARAPDGSERTVAFTVAFAEAATMPEVGFFVCQQHRPENFWNPAFQVHPGGTKRMKGFVLVAPEPEIHLPFLTRFAGSPSPLPIPGGFTVPLHRGRIELLTPDAFQDAYGTGKTWPDDETRIGCILLETEPVVSSAQRIVIGSQGSNVILIHEHPDRPDVIAGTP